MSSTNKKKSFFRLSDLKNQYQMGAHLGHKANPLIERHLSWHPSMASALLGKRNGLTFISSQTTEKSLCRAFYILAEIINKKGHVLVVNTNPDFYKLCQYTVARLNSPYVSSCFFKWTGGTLTNYKQVSKSIHSFIKFTERCESTQTSLNVFDFPRYQKMKKCFQGYFLTNNSNQGMNNTIKLTLPQKPDIIFCMNPQENKNLILEAKKLNIPVIALVESNANITFIDYPIPSNHSSMEFTFYVLKKFVTLVNALQNTK